MMLTFDLILLRILFTGIATSLLLLIFWLLRRFCTPLTRRVVWLILILCALFVMPIPLTIKLPATWPDWIFDWRLPDPTQLILSRDNISRLFQHFSTGKGAADVPIGDLLQSRGFLPVLTPGDWLVQYLPVLRIVYLAGLIFTIAYLSLRSMQGKKIWQQKVNQSNGRINQEAWQGSIVKLRDDLGIYRQYDPLITDDQMLRPINVYLNWRYHKILVPSANPADIAADASRQWLGNQLKKNRISEPLWLSGWLIVRCLLWFSPVWALSSRKLLTDTAKQPTEVTHRSRLLSVLVMSLIAFITLVGLLWQLPQKMERDYRQQNMVIPEEIGLLAVKADDYVENSTDSLYSHYLTMDGDNVWLMNPFNKPVWSSTISGLIKLEEDQGYIQTNYRKIMDLNWSFLVGVGARRIGAEKFYRLIFDAQGQILDHQLVWSDQIADSFSSVGYDPEFVLTDDGGWLMIIRSRQTAEISAMANATVEAIRWMVRYDSKGQEVWRLDHDAFSRLQGIFISLDNGIGLFGSIGFGKVLRQLTTGPAGSTILLSTDYTSLGNYYDDSEGTPDSFSNAVRYRWIISLLDAGGQLKWHRTISANNLDLYVNQIQCPENAVYLLCDLQDQINNTITPTLMSLTMDGDIEFTCQLDEYRNYQWVDFYSAGDCLTGVLMNYQDETVWPVKVFQLNYDGRPIGAADLRNRNRIINVETGIISYAEPRERINP